MTYKKWIYSGAAIFIGSCVAGLLGTVWGIYSGFDALKANESAGIGAVGGGIGKALFFTVFFLVTGRVGLAVLIAGCIKAYRYSKSKNNELQP